MDATIPFAGFLISLFLTPYIARLMKKAGIVGRDVHKPEKPEVPEMGGIALLISLAMSLGLSPSEVISKAVLMALLFGLTGILDDLTVLKQSHKVLLCLIMSIPILSLPLNHTLNLFGLAVDIGLAYPVFAILFITASANLVNMLAGFNGLEVGTSSIALLSLALITKGDAQMLALAGLGASLGFLWWNRYPAKVFPGDVGTLSLGALIGVIGILGKVEVYAAILLIPHAVDFLLKMRIRFRGKAMGRTEILEDGTLKAPPYLSFLGLIMRAKRVKEWQLVSIVWLLELALGMFVFLLHL
ncbi:MraY family glycosyltransferase [Palaeococcus sp. (in: euryarchaeotes)]